MEDVLQPIVLPAEADAPPSRQERSTAQLLWLLNIVIHILAPWALWWLQGQGSRFIAHHARACINHTLTVLVLILIACSVVGGLTWVCLTQFPDDSLAPLIGAAALLALLVLAVVGLGLVSLTIHIVAALKAARGEWYAPPLCWRFLR